MKSTKLRVLGREPGGARPRDHDTIDGAATGQNGHAKAPQRPCRYRSPFRATYRSRCGKNLMPVARNLKTSSQTIRTRTGATPRPVSPIFRAAAGERSRSRPGAYGPLSVTVTRTDLSPKLTSNSVPKGRLLWAAV